MPRRHLLEVKLQATRQDRDRNFLRVGGGEYKFHMRRRLFQRLEHRIKGEVGQHVDFVDHVDFETGVRGRVHGLLEQLRHFIDTPVRRGIHFNIVNEATGIDCGASVAHTARGGGDVTVAVSALAIEGLGQNA